MHLDETFTDVGENSKIVPDVTLSVFPEVKVDGVAFLVLFSSLTGLVTFSFNSPADIGELPCSLTTTAESL